MFYFLIFHTTISASSNIENKLLTTLFYGSILYLLLGGLINKTDYQILKYISSFYWYILIIDIVILVYVTRNVIDYKNILDKFLDTSIYEIPINKSSINPPNVNNYHNIKENINNIINEKQNKQVFINEHENEIYNYDSNQNIVNNNMNNDMNNDLYRNNTNETFTHATSLEDLGFNNENTEENNDENINDIINNFQDSIDNTNISEIESINLDDFNPE